MLLKFDDQYLFRVLLRNMGYRLSPNRTPKQTYIEKAIGGTVWSFGNNDLTQLSPISSRINSPTLIPGLKNIIQVVGGTISVAHLLLLNNEGRVWGFGINNSGQLGLGNNDNPRAIATLIPNLRNIIEVSAAGSYSLCLDNQGHVWSFGHNKHGQLGLGDLIDRNTPTMIPNLNDIIQVSAGGSYLGYHSLCVDKQGHVWSFGYNEYGQLGLGDKENRNIPTMSPILKNIVPISCGEYYSFCLDDQGHVWSFGENGRGQLGLGDYTNRVIPTIIDRLEHITMISASINHSLCLDHQGHVWSFGINTIGQLGLGNYKQTLVPTIIPNLNDIIEITTGRSHSLCLDNQGRVWSFGKNNGGQLGLGDFENRIVPTLIPNVNNAIQINAGGEYSTIIRL
jgi:alpha-tubulin suppressor-like RCC1 family protein